MKSLWVLGCCGALLVIGGLGRSYLLSTPVTADNPDPRVAIAQSLEAPTPSHNDPAHQAILADLIEANIIYLGETHTNIADHQAQLEIITAMDQARGNITIGLEMFQRPFQSVLDQYIAGEITEADLIEQSEYETRWGFDWELYAPILRYAQTHQIPLIALNTPQEVTRKVAQQGLASLGGDDLQHIPPIADIDTRDKDYRAMIADVFSHHGGHGHSGPSFENFFAAQVLWDETMAEAIADAHTTSPDTQVIVLAGKGHIVYGYGIPNRVARRLGNDLVAHSVLLNPTATATELSPDLADSFWFTATNAVYDTATDGTPSSNIAP